MPQMAPLSWLSLFIVFLALFMASINKIYFSSFNSSVTKKIMKQEYNKSFMIWKW